MSAARQAWIAAHPYLEPVDRLQRIVEEAAAEAPGAEPRRGSWAPDPAADAPLLRSARVRSELSATVAGALGRIVERLVDSPLPGNLVAAGRDLRDAFRGDPGERDRAMEWILACAAPDPAARHAGLLRLLGWTAARPVLAAAASPAEWRDEARWGRGHCPTCGSLPAMAWLAPGEAARPRFMICGCCGTRWRYRRIGCPFCGEENPERLEVLQVEEDPGLRLDTCAGCGGYLKTYAGAGEEELFLADWSTLHLDVAAQGRGLRRMGASLYDT